MHNCPYCDTRMRKVPVEIPGCDDPVFRAYCHACEFLEDDDDDDGAFDRDELGIDPEEDYKLYA